MACLAPWAFGSVDAWVELALALGVALLGTLAIFSSPGINPIRSPVKELLDQEPIRRYLVPAARCFLQARRCRLVSAHAQVGLAISTTCWSTVILPQSI